MRAPLLIVNPAARGGRSAAAEALRACAASGIAPQVRTTSAPGDAARFAREAPEREPILVLGGDGTVMEVVGAVVGRGVPVGILPGGTGNQLARHLRIPLRVGRAVRALSAASPVPLDLGRLTTGRHFALTAGLGVDAAMIAGASPAAKRRFGVAAYLLSGARAVVATRPFPVRIEVDGRVIEREAGLAMVANVGAVMDGRFGLGPGVRPDDGWLDLCVLTARGMRDGLALAGRMARRDFRDDPRMLFVRAKRVRIDAPAGVPCQADGELLAAAGVDAEIVPSGALFLAPTAPRR